MSRAPVGPAADLSGRHTDAPGREGWVSIRWIIDDVPRTISSSPPPRGLGGSRAVATGRRR